MQLNCFSRMLSQFLCNRGCCLRGTPAGAIPIALGETSLRYQEPAPKCDGKINLGETNVSHKLFFRMLMPIRHGVAQQQRCNMPARGSSQLAPNFAGFDLSVRAWMATVSHGDSATSNLNPHGWQIPRKLVYQPILLSRQCPNRGNLLRKTFANRYSTRTYSFFLPYNLRNLDIPRK